MEGRGQREDQDGQVEAGRAKASSPCFDKRGTLIYASWPSSPSLSQVGGRWDRAPALSVQTSLDYPRIPMLCNNLYHLYLHNLYASVCMFVYSSARHMFAHFLHKSCYITLETSAHTTSIHTFIMIRTVMMKTDINVPFCSVLMVPPYVVFLTVNS